VSVLDSFDASENPSPISTSLGIAIFLLGDAVGALLTRLQWNAFKQKSYRTSWNNARTIRNPSRTRLLNLRSNFSLDKQTN
jgi:hypothetical protein